MIVSVDKKEGKVLKTRINALNQIIILPGIQNISTPEHSRDIIVPKFILVLDFMNWFKDFRIFHGKVSFWLKHRQQIRLPVLSSEDVIQIPFNTLSLLAQKKPQTPKPGVLRNLSPTEHISCGNPFLLFVPSHLHLNHVT